MKTMNLMKSVLILSILSSAFISSKAEAFERYTWSELVTGSKNSAEAEKLSIVSEWCGLKRIVKSDETCFVKMRKAQEVLFNKQKHSSGEIFKAVMDLRYIYLYSFKDLDKADNVLKQLENIPELQNKVAAERLFASFKTENLLKDDFYDGLYNINNKEGVFPYDNGYMPVITKEHASTMLAIKEMIDGKGKQTEKQFSKAWKEIPSDVIYLIATDQRENAYKLYQNMKSSLDTKTVKLVDDFLYPLYTPVKKANRKFLAGVFCVEVFPGLGMDLINEALTDSPRVSKPEHALACLSDVYARHNAYDEAQKVLKLLKEYYPDSIWLK